jgi:hypothetical protein
MRGIGHDFNDLLLYHLNQVIAQPANEGSEE